MREIIEVFSQEELKQLEIISKGGKSLFSNLRNDNLENLKTTSSLFSGNEVGKVRSDLSEGQHLELVEQIAPLLLLESFGYSWESIVELFNWVKKAKDLYPDICDWIGIYYKANYYLNEESTELVLGPYFGESTTHTRIPLEKGLCGLALREERVVNVANVHEDSRHIACSLKTNSELIIPLKNEQGEMVAELDIDCNKLGAFSSAVEKDLKEYCEGFLFRKRM